MPKKMRDLPDYLPEQMRYEGEYYDNLTSIVAGLITLLLGNIETNRNTNIAILNSLYMTWLQQQDAYLYGLAKQQALNITNLAEKTVGSEMIRNRETVERLSTQIKVTQQNTFNSIFGMFVTLVPIGVVGLYAYFFNEDTTRDDIYKRTTSRIKDLCVNTYGQGVFNTILLAARLKGYSEYLGDNKHDSRVREMHRIYFNGETWIPFDSPPPCGHLVSEKNCRCVAVALR